MKIRIDESLRDYLERIYVESVRYEDLLHIIRRDFCDMTDEEWESSRKYYQDLCIEAQMSKRAMFESLEEIYPEIKGTQWRIDFENCLITDEPADPDRITAKYESYADQLNRLYPEYRDNVPLHINGKHCKDITLQVTENCNLRCTYCYQHNKTMNTMSFDTAKQFIDMILDADERTNTYIDSSTCIGAIFDFIGGEPWLEIDLINKISNYIIGELFRRKHPWMIRFMFSICSNGMLHFDERVQEYLKTHKYHLSYSISIDGDKELHDSCRIDMSGNGSYDRAIAAVKDYCKDGDNPIGSKMTISPNNVHCVKKAVISMIENGYKHINLNCVYEEGWQNEHANTLYWQLHELIDWLYDNNHMDDITLSILDEKHCCPLTEDNNNNWCGGTGLMLALDWKGDIYPCLRYMESSTGRGVEPYTIGNIKDGINVLPEHCDRVNCMGCITRRSQSTDECFNCPIASGCGWCSAYNYEVFGTNNKRATYICCMHKARSLALYYYLKRKNKNPVMYCPEEWAIPIIGQEEYDNLIERG